MIPSIQELIQTLKEARESKDLSQRALADRLGIPQSHLSKIETGEVNIRLAGFVELARHLELEVMLIPRQKLSLVKGLVRSHKEPGESHEMKPAYTLTDEKDEGKDEEI